MTIGTSVFIAAVGAILYFAVEDSISGVDLSTVGLILMVAGAIGLLIGIWMALAARRRYAATYEDPAYRDPAAVDPAYRDPAAYPQQQAPPAQAPPPPPPAQRY